MAAISSLVRRDARHGVQVSSASGALKSRIWSCRQRRPARLRRMIDYGQFCTVARGAEVLGELWTPLVVRELLCGSRRFNDIHRGVPRMSATLLTQRLRKLEAIGVVERRRGDGRLGISPHAGGRGAAPDRGRPRALGRALDRQPAQARAARCRLPDVGHPPLRAARRVSGGPAHRDPLSVHAMRRAASGCGGWWWRTGPPTCAATIRATRCRWSSNPPCAR